MTNSYQDNTAWIVKPWLNQIDQQTTKIHTLASNIHTN